MLLSSHSAASEQQSSFSLNTQALLTHCPVVQASALKQSLSVVQHPSTELKRQVPSAQTSLVQGLLSSQSAAELQQFGSARFWQELSTQESSVHATSSSH
jgi:hypothetical protein